jgi:hypothetical protein
MGSVMKIFLSWSGDRSRTLARLMKEWLPDVVSYFEPWVSSEDVEQGARWAAEIGRQLENCDVGVILLTPENVAAPWVLFEAGALAKTVEHSRVCTYLLGVDPESLSGPLVQFQATRANQQDTFRLLRTLNGLLGERRRTDAQLERAFSQWWPNLQKALEHLLASPGVERPRVSDRDILLEMLDLARQQARPAPPTVHASFARLLAFDSLFDDAATRAFERTVALSGDPADPNALPWSDAGLPHQPDALDGVWSSRWREGYDGGWHRGTATVLKHGDLCLILHTDPGFQYFMLTRLAPGGRLVGRHYNLSNIKDTSPWVGQVVSSSRIDGEWSRGRWDLRRPD